MASKQYSGSCHCGQVKFEATADLDAGTSRCNCSVCGKTRFWKAIVLDKNFRLTSGKDTLSEYTFGSGGIHHLFCKHCGVKPFGTGDIEAIGGKFWAINIACLENITPEELARLPVKFEDGRHDNWGNAPAETKYL